MRTLSNLQLLTVAVLKKRALDLLNATQTHTATATALANKLSKGMKRKNKSLAFIAAYQAMTIFKRGIVALKCRYSYRVVAGKEFITFLTREEDNHFDKWTLESVAQRKHLTLTIIGE